MPRATRKVLSSKKRDTSVIIKRSKPRTRTTKKGKSTTKKHDKLPEISYLAATASNNHELDSEKDFDRDARKYFGAETDRDGYKHIYKFKNRDGTKTSHECSMEELEEHMHDVEKVANEQKEGQMSHEKRCTAETFSGLDVIRVPEVGDFKVTPLMENHIFPKHPYRLLLVGESGGGKTNLLLWLTHHEAEKDYFDRTYLFGNSCKTDPAFKKLVKSGIVRKSDVFTKNIRSEAEKIIDQRIDEVESSPNGKYSDNLKPIRLIFEDITNQADLIRSEPLIFALTATRHLNMSVIIVGHKFTCIIKVARINVTDICYFSLPLTDMETLYEEYCPSSLKKKAFMRMVEWATTQQPGEQNEKPFLRVCKRVPVADRFRKGFDRIIEWEKLREPE